MNTDLLLFKLGTPSFISISMAGAELRKITLVHNINTVTAVYRNFNKMY
jgi:hypothetical protein